MHPTPKLKAYIERVQGLSVETHGGEKENLLKTLMCVSSAVPPKSTSNVTVTLPLYAKIVVVLLTAQHYTVNQIPVLQETIDRMAGRAPEHSRMLATPVLMFVAKG